MSQRPEMSQVSVLCEGRKFFHRERKTLHRKEIPEDGIVKRDDEGKPVEILTRVFTWATGGERRPCHNRTVRFEEVKPGKLDTPYTRCDLWECAPSGGEN